MSPERSRPESAKHGDAGLTGDLVIACFSRVMSPAPSIKIKRSNNQDIKMRQVRRGQKDVYENSS